MNCVPFLNTRVHSRFTVLVVLLNLKVFCAVLCGPLFGLSSFLFFMVISLSVSLRWTASIITPLGIFKVVLQEVVFVDFDRIWKLAIDSWEYNLSKVIYLVNLLFIIIFWFRAKKGGGVYNKITWFRLT